MIQYGKRLNKNKMPALDKMYTIQGKDEYKSILFAHGKGLEERVKELKIDNAIIRKESNCLRVWIGPRQRAKSASHWYIRNAGDFEKGIWVVEKGELRSQSKLCHMCKDKMKGIVDECTTTNTWNKQLEKACVFDLHLPETTIDLSGMREVSNGLLNIHSAFRSDSALSEISFSWTVINRNLEAFKGRALCSKNKPKKMLKHCSKCIFECGSKLINSNNVGNKCCLTYDQALKSGFFKDLKIRCTTSIYDSGIFVDDSKIGGYGDKITLHENKYVRFQEKQQTKEETQK